MEPGEIREYGKGGLAALGISILAATLLGRRAADGARIFILPWLAAAIINMVIGLRVKDEVEREGLDLALHGEAVQ